MWHAGLWSGTAASWVDLHPAGSESSQAFGTSGTQQVGYAVIGGMTHAGLWGGTAESWEDLSLALTGSWSNTSANGIWSDGLFTYVVGNGNNLETGITEALLWTRPVPAPGAALLLALGGRWPARRRR